MDTIALLIEINNRLQRVENKLSEKINPPTSELIFFKEIRDTYHISPATLTRKIAEKNIKTVQPGKEKAIYRKDLPKLLY
jgi:hypothetical protein